MSATDTRKLAVHSVSTLTADVVVDVGCVTWLRPAGESPEDSIPSLVRRFTPRVLFGFDPHPGLEEHVGEAYGTVVLTSRQAAWTYDGTIPLDLHANCTHVGEGQDVARCFDLAHWLLSLPDAETVLKLDCEGAEYVLLPHLIETGAIDRVSRLLVEWHEGRLANGLQSDRAAIIAGIHCPIEEWA